MKNDFGNTYGYDFYKKPLFLFGLTLLLVFFAFLLDIGGLLAGVAILVLPFLLTYLYFVFSIPKTGLIILYIFNYFVLGLTRYIEGVPLGLGVDAQFFIIYLALLYQSFFTKVPWKNAKNELVLLAFIWYGYVFFQLLNPEAASRVAWFYAMRGIALYMLFTIPLIFIIFNKRKDLNLFLNIWAILSLLATLKGMMQHFIGPDPWEQAWLNGGGDVTHVIFGKLRVFSFMSDAGQFGGAQGHSGVVFLILAFHQKKSIRLRIFYAVTGLLALYGMMISGTRGSIAVPLMGFALYFVIRKNLYIISAGILALIAVFIFFKYTTIGQSNYTIRRMRSAFDYNDPSLQVRLENQRRLASYLSARPFGGGVGSSGNWGMRFTPNTFLAQTPTDSWFVMIWADMGIVGLMLHLFILFYIVLKSSYIIMFKLKDPWIKAQMSALVCGMWGVIVASYGNGVLGQMPTGIIIYSSMAFLFLSPKFDKIAVKENLISQKV